MKPNPITDWQELSTLYERADQLDDMAQTAWLAQLQQTGHRLLPQLQRLLQARARLRGSDWLAEPPRLRASLDTPDSDWSEGDPIGPYRLSRALGSGGMAEVWLAERSDGAFTRSVAIKLLYRQASGSRRDSFRQRFERERDILASLTHPHIASLLDAGVTASGQPWIALEYVQGEPLTDWCDQQKLGVAARVRLFLQVLLAVQHAHANLVIHRDLKPANILVTAQAQVQLLDFGIAKLIEADGRSATETEFTRVAGRALTPQYASPEQLRGLPLSTASDVYSLGVVLYELLCGEQPYALKFDSAAQLEQAILEAEPQAPSRRLLSAVTVSARAGSVKALRKTLASDLDAIVLKALAKMPQQRYASVEALRQDLQRWLDRKPVQAKAPSAVYQLRKFIGRHRWAVALGSTAVLSLIALATVALLLGLQARQESARAIAARDFLIDMFRQADPDLSHGADITARQLLEQGQKTILNTLKTQPQLQADLLRGLGDAQANMSDYRKADTVLREAVNLYQTLGQASKAAQALVEQAEAVYASGDSRRADELLARAAALYLQQDGGAGPMARYHEVKSVLEMGKGDLPAAKVSALQSLAEVSQAFGEHDPRTIDAMRAVARIEAKTGDLQAAIQRLDAAVARSTTANGSEPKDIIAIQTERAELELAAGRFVRAAELFNSTAVQCEQTLDRNGETCTGLRQREVVLLLIQGYRAKAFQLLPSLLAQANSEGSPSRQAEALVAACRVLGLNGKQLDYPELWARIRTLGNSGDEVKLPDYIKLYAQLAQAEILLHQLQPAAAQTLLRQAEARFEAGNQTDRRILGRLRLFQGLAAQLLGQDDRALPLLQTAFTEYAKLMGEHHPLSLLMRVHQARSLSATLQSDKALALLDNAIPELREALGPQAPAIAGIVSLRAELALQHDPRLRVARKADLFL